MNQIQKQSALNKKRINVYIGTDLYTVQNRYNEDPHRAIR